MELARRRNLRSMIAARALRYGWPGTQRPRVLPGAIGTQMCGLPLMIRVRVFAGRAVGVDAAGAIGLAAAGLVDAVGATGLATGGLVAGGCVAIDRVTTSEAVGGRAETCDVGAVDRARTGTATRAAVEARVGVVARTGGTATVDVAGAAAAVVARADAEPSSGAGEALGGAMILSRRAVT